MNRDAMLAELERRGSEPWDLALIGGGATGLGVALDAAARGYRCVLLEKSDFAKGTSSRSTKLIHGGVRYLRQGNVALVRDSLRERGILLQNAPGLVKPLPFLVPSYRWHESPYYGIGLKMYDLLAGNLGIDSSRHLSRGEALDFLPNLEASGLRGGTLYYDAQFDDAGLALATARAAAGQGAVLLNYAEVMGLLKADGRVRGVGVRDIESGREFELTARVVVNATGPFTDEVRRMDDSKTLPLITPSQGVHIVLDSTFLPGDGALMVPRTDDGRVIFMIPWQGKVLVGTTDTPREDAPLEPQALPGEIDYLLEHAARYLKVRPSREDILSVFAGIRPLAMPGRGRGGEKTSAVSRDHVLRTSESGLVTITGGKWTTFRKMAEDTVDLAARLAGLEARPCTTGQLALVPGAVEAVQEEVAGRYDPRIACGEGEVRRGVQEEMARTVEDVLARRTRCLLLDARASAAIAPAVATEMAKLLGRDGKWIKEQVAEFEALARRYLPPGA